MINEPVQAAETGNSIKPLTVPRNRKVGCSPDPPHDPRLSEPFVGQESQMAHSEASWVASGARRLQAGPL